jgi:hypothetical protein
MSHAWTNMTKDQRIAALAPLTAEGYSASQIGAMLGVTRNVVIGFWHRNADLLPKPDVGGQSNKSKRQQLADRLRTRRKEREEAEMAKLPTLRREQAEAKAEDTKPAPKLPGGFKFGFQGGTRPTTRPEPIAMPVVEFVPESSGHPTITTASFGQCRFPHYDRASAIPISEHFICGEPTVSEKSSWCAEHHARVFQPVARRQEVMRQLMKMASVR